MLPHLLFVTGVDNIASMWRPIFDSHAVTNQMLIIEVVYLDQKTDVLPPTPMRLLYNGVTGGCPSLVAHQLADWWPRLEPGSYGLDSIMRPDEWSQRVIQGVSAPLPVGVHRLALVSSAGAEGTPLKISAAIVCQAGFANADGANFSGVCEQCPPGEAKPFGSGSATSTAFDARASTSMYSDCGTSTSLPNSMSTTCRNPSSRRAPRPRLPRARRRRGAPQAARGGPPWALPRPTRSP